MAKCLRCGAGSEWLEGRVADEPVAAGYHERIKELEGKLNEVRAVCYEQFSAGKCSSLVALGLIEKIVREPK